MTNKEEEEDIDLTTEVGRDLGTLSEKAGRFIGGGLIMTYRGIKIAYRRGREYLREKYQEGKREGRKKLRGRGRGWYGQPGRHRLASYGIKTTHGGTGYVNDVGRDVLVLTAEGRYTDKAKQFVDRTSLLTKLSAIDPLPKHDLVGFQIEDVKDTVPDKENVSEITMQTLQEMGLWDDSYRDIVISNYPEYEDGAENDYVYKFEVEGRGNVKAGMPGHEGDEHVWLQPKIRGWVHGTVDEKGDIETLRFRINGVSNLVIRDKIVRWLQSI